MFTACVRAFSRYRFQQGFCATFKGYRTSIKFRDTETIDQGLNQDDHRHWVPNPEAL